jgi:hypothetical protein
LVISAVSAVGNNPTCQAPLSSLVGWWPDDLTGKDLVGSRDAALSGGMQLGPGKVLRSYTFDGVNDEIVVDPAPRVENGLTLEAWVLLPDLTQPQPILEYSRPCPWPRPDPQQTPLVVLDENLTGDHPQHGDAQRDGQGRWPARSRGALHPVARPERPRAGGPGEPHVADHLRDLQYLRHICPAPHGL